MIQGLNDLLALFGDLIAYLAIACFAIAFGGYLILRAIGALENVIDKPVRTK